MSSGCALLVFQWLRSSIARGGCTRARHRRQTALPCYGSKDTGHIACCVTLLTPTGSNRSLLQVQAGSQLAAADTQHGIVAAQPLPTSPGSTASQLLAAPRLVTPPVLCSESGGGSEPIQLVLVGPGLAQRSVALHCRSRGRHQVVTIMRVRQSATAAGGLQEPSTPPPTDRRSADSDFGSEHADAWAPSPAGPAAAASTRAQTAAEAAFEAASLDPGEDALLVQLSAPAQGWGLFELEVAAGERRAAGMRS